MKLSSSETLLAALPIIFVLVALIGAILFFPKTNNDTRSKASNPVPTITKVAPPTATPTAAAPTPTISKTTPTSETACTELYSPVCGTNNITFSNECEASKAHIAIAYFGECK